MAFFRSFDIMDKISLHNLHMKTTGDSGNTYREQQLSFLL